MTNENTLLKFKHKDPDLSFRLSVENELLFIYFSTVRKIKFSGLTKGIN
jgi:hypothetical protein